MEFNIELEDMNEDQSEKAFREVISELTKCVDRNPGDAVTILQAIRDGIEEFEGQDFFGTEGLLRE